MTREFVPLGVITKPHGIGGEVRLHAFNPDSQLLLEFEELWLRVGDEFRVVALEDVREHGKVFLARVHGVHTRAGAEALRGAELGVDRADLPEVEDDEYYHHDLIGLRALDDSGAPIGIVVEVLPYPSVDALVIQSDEGFREIPIVSPYVGSVDVDSGTIHMAHLDDFELRKKR